MADNNSEPRYRSKYPRPKRKDGRVQCLVFLKPDLIKRLKQVAIGNGESTYHLVERELSAAIKRIDAAGSKASDHGDDGPKQVEDPDENER